MDNPVTGDADLKGMPEPHGALTEQKNRLIEDVMTLAEEIGPRNSFHYESLRRAESYILETFTDSGYEPFRQQYEVDGREFSNIIAEVPGARWRARSSSSARTTIRT